MKRSGWFITFLIVIGILAFVAWKAASLQNNLLESDFFTFWLGSKLVLEGQNPYDPGIWQAGHQIAGSRWLENPVYCYPLPLAYVTLLIGAIPISIAGPVWLFLSGLSVMAAVVILIIRSRAELQLKYFMPMIVGFALFRPVMVTFRNGQLGGFYLLIIVMVLLLIDRQKWIPAGLAIIPLFLKPTLGLPFIGLLFIWLIINGRWKSVITSAIGGLLIFLMSLFHQPNWVSAFLDIGLQKGSDVFMITPTIWGISGISCGMDAGCTRIAGAVIFIILSVASVILTIKHSRVLSIWTAGSLFVIVTLLITPYLWAYDQILLILPIMTIIHQLRRLKAGYLLVSLLPLFFAIVSLFLLYIAMINKQDVFSILLTIITGVLFFVGIIWQKKVTHGTEYL